MLVDIMVWLLNGWVTKYFHIVKRGGGHENCLCVRGGYEHFYYHRAFQPSPDNC